MAERHATRSPTGIAPVLQLHPTRRCNIACSHCYTASGPAANEELQPELLAACLEDAVALGYRQLAVSGGEPLVYRHLARLLAHARTQGLVTTVTTNGMLLTPRRWAELAGLVDVLAVSVDGRPDEHDEIRRCEGAFERMRRSLEVVRSSGTPFGFIFTLTRHNADSLEFVVRLAAQEGARSVQVHPLTLSGRALDTMAGSQPDAQELVVALWEAARLGAEIGVVVHVDALSAGQLRAHRDRLVPSRPVTRVVDVAPVLSVAADGTVVPLTHDVAPALHLGALAGAGLGVLAREWLLDGRADALAAACARAWDDVVRESGAAAVYWYDEVAARTRPIAEATPPLVLR